MYETDVFTYTHTRIQVHTHCRASVVKGGRNTKLSHINLNEASRLHLVATLHGHVLSQPRHAQLEPQACPRSGCDEHTEAGT